MFIRKLWLVFASAGLVTALSSTSARAQTCDTNADCAQGTVCQPSSSVPPTAATTPPSCPQGVDCGVGTGSMTPPDAVIVVPPPEKFCQAAPCMVDAECGAAMVCHTERIGTCSGGTAVPRCADTTKCPDVTPVETTCTTTSVSLCAYRWQLPCNTAADCGSDFTCVPSVTSSCSGGGVGTSGSAGGGTSAPTTGTGGSSSSGGPLSSDAKPATPVAPVTVGGVAPDSVTCTTTSSFPGYCQPKATTCSVDSDCPAAWTCAVSIAPTAVAGTGSRHASDAPAVANGGVATEPASGPAADSVPTATPPFCQSPSGFWSRHVESKDSTGSGSAGAVATGGAPSGSVTPQPETPPAAPGAGASAGEKAAAASEAGCSIAGAGMGGGMSLFGLATVATVTMSLRRRRRR